MCGIAGYYSLDKHTIDRDKFRRMLEAIAHRGPDDSGYAIFNSASGRSCHAADPGMKVTNDFPSDLIFGHRRLSIIDLSASGRQPMSDEEGRLWIIFNGEIYNYIELREELRSFGHTFRTNSDTEVIIRSYAQWGEECVSRFNGMFAFGLWDAGNRKLFCARDRMGVKPFYYYYDGSRFVFASEIKAILEIGIERKPNDQSVHDYLSKGLLDHTGGTFFHDINQLRPAHFAVISDGELRIRRWWDISNSEECISSDEEYARRFHVLFEDSIRLRLRSDVPIGTCLSGGLDSSSIVCVANSLMFQGNYSSALVGSRQKTFSSCFDDRRYDERIFIDDVIKKTNASPHYTFPEGGKLFELMPDVIRHQDEPFSSTSVFAQWHVMKLASENGVKVLLDGQGADEILAGYHTYFGSYYIDLIKKLRFAKLIKELFRYREIHKGLNPVIFASLVRVMLNRYLISFIGKMPVIRNAPVAATIGNYWINSDFKKAHEREHTFTRKFKSSLKNHLYNSLSYSSLPALLHHEDRNSMAFSIETRLPFLDYRLVEYVFSLPSSQKLKNGMTKTVLRNTMKDILPESIRTRTDKMGFVTPEDIWFRTILKDKILAIIGSQDFRDIGYFDVPELKKEFRLHCEGQKNISSAVWRWVNLFLWHNMFMRAS